MNRQELTRASAPSSSSALATVLRCWWRGCQQRLATHTLHQHIDRLATLAEQHCAAGVNAGDPRFQLLLEEAEQAVADYAATWQVDPARLRAELPPLTALERLATPAPSRVPVLLLLLVLAPFILGLMTGLAQLGYVLGSFPAR